MSQNPRAGQPTAPHDLIRIPRLLAAYYSERPDPGTAAQRVSFGTSGHRGSSERGSFNEDHILAVTQAICEYRAAQGVTGPLFLGQDTHALSEPAFRTALEVLAANGVAVRVDAQDGYTPTPVISHAILAWNREHQDAPADGIVISPSHNPPGDGGFKYNPPHGGPADTDATKWIENRANALLAAQLADVQRVDYARARKANTTVAHDYLNAYSDDLGAVIDLDAIRSAGVRVGADPLGGASVAYWGRIAERHRLTIEVVNPNVDPTFAFMRLDWDGKIRMDCSSPFAMGGLIGLRDRFQVAIGNDTDADRHGIVTPAGLMNPNHFLAAAVAYLFRHRPAWPKTAAIGKTLVSSSLIDRVARALERRLVEVPVGFKWFVPGLMSGELGFGGEESAGATFLRRDGRVWTTDKDGLILGLLAAEITAVLGKDPHALYLDLIREHGEPTYERTDAPATPEQKAALSRLAPQSVAAKELAGAPIECVLSHAPGNQAPIGGLKVVTQDGWFAARPSGTEDVYKIYAESFRGRDHLRRIQEEARALVTDALTRA
ncbi:MAG: phosphoglucomutase (alpha-D-glucose-1,6-bisphosphate-dependent) [Vicinamibacteria bacterium]|nr:phosphoglucomutase (alpha-D-glucose-1,6-bisphosphate-dependent) [Vicinamibacteria bacterium]